MMILDMHQSTNLPLQLNRFLLEGSDKTSRYVNITEEAQDLTSTNFNIHGQKMEKLMYSWISLAESSSFVPTWEVAKLIRCFTLTTVISATQWLMALSSCQNRVITWLTSRISKKKTSSSKTGSPTQDTSITKTPMIKHTVYLLRLDWQMAWDIRRISFLYMKRITFLIIRLEFSSTWFHRISLKTS